MAHSIPTDDCNRRFRGVRVRRGATWPGGFLSLGLLLIASVLASPQLDFLEIHYIANEGAFLQFREQQVLIDALFVDGLGSYESPDAEKLRLLQKAAAPYDRVQAVLVTHAHADHFDPVLTRDYLKANTTALLIAPNQVIGKLREQEGVGEIESRLLGFSLPPGERKAVAAGNITVEVLGLPHSGQNRDLTENLGYLVQLGNQKILHVGDAAPELRDFQPLQLPADRVDIFLVPFWFAIEDDGAAFIRQWIQPRRLIGIHLETSAPGNLQRLMTARFAEAVVFSNALGKNIYLATILE